MPHEIAASHKVAPRNDAHVNNCLQRMPHAPLVMTVTSLSKWRVREQLVRQKLLTEVGRCLAIHGGFANRDRSARTDPKRPHGAVFFKEMVLNGCGKGG